MKISKPATLMLIDDSLLDLKINEKVAQHTNLFDNIIPFTSAQSAIDYLKNCHNIPDKLPQVILVDLQMPNIDGFGFIDEYTTLLPDALRKKCLLAMLSSTEDCNQIQRAQSHPNIIKFIKKPLLVNTLESLVTQLQ
jgi:Response regulator containing a CheY-like receiver domain and an HD-GYP domain